MKYRLYRKGMNKKTIAILTVICFITLSISQCNAGDPKLGEDQLCYGFIVPLVRCENLSLGNQIYCKTMHMINDLLREQIPVYWMTTNMTVSIKNIDSMIEQGMFFERGTFIIPFTGNNTQDKKIVAIVCDYNYSSEIEENSTIKISVYELMEQLNTPAYQLSDVKMAQYKDFLTCCESWYLNVAEKCGFLNFKILNNNVVSKELNNTAYNLIIWPGYDGYYPSSYSFLDIFIDSYSQRTNAIRKFVRNGGGFVGSCYAVTMASRGSPPIVYSKRRVQNPNLPSFGFLAITDFLTGAGVTSPYLEERIANHTHPVTYGVDEITVKGFSTGPTFRYIGKDVNVIAEFKNDSDLGGKPSCVSSNFGKGKVVLFSPHYEIRDPDTNPFGAKIDLQYNGKKFIVNAFYYITSKKTMQIDLHQSRNLSFIFYVKSQTLNLSNNLDFQSDVFDFIKLEINKTIIDTFDLINKINSNLNIIEQIKQDMGINESESLFYYYPNYFSNYCLGGFFIRYLNNTIKSLIAIEKIYPLLENEEFIRKIEILKTKLTSNINELQNAISKCKIACENHEKLLLEYQNSSIHTNFQKRKIDEAGHKIEVGIASGFNYLPQIYFDSLKFLRTSWYNYEAGIAL